MSERTQQHGSTPEHESQGTATEVATAPEDPQAQQEPRGPRGPSAPTVVLGLVLAAVATLLLGRELGLVEVELVTSGVWLLLGSGAALVLWALMSMIGRRGPAR